jgi:hypothetical protein
VFVTLIIKNPIIQIFAMLLGLGILAIEFPIKPLKQSSLHRSFPLKIVLLMFQAFLTILYYQVCFSTLFLFSIADAVSLQGTNASIYSMIAAFAYTRAQMKGEEMKDAKANRGKAEGA